MDLERAPGASLPPVCQPAKVSDADTVKERRHLYREMKLGHWIRPDYPPPTAAQVRVVPKPGEEELPILERC